MHNTKLKGIKRALTVLLSAMVIVSAIPAKTVQAAGGTNKTAAEVVSDMTVGWNIGNSLDATGQAYLYPCTTSMETYWGNPALMVIPIL